MDSTPVSLLERLRQPSDTLAWDRFVRLYTPLLYHWLRRTGLQEADAADLVQDVLTVLVTKLPEFVYDRGKRFHGWLRTLAVNRWRDLRSARHSCKRVAALIDDADRPRSARIVHRIGVSRASWRCRRCGIMRSDFQPATFQAVCGADRRRQPGGGSGQEAPLHFGRPLCGQVPGVGALRRELKGIVGVKLVTFDNTVEQCSMRLIPVLDLQTR